MVKADKKKEVFSEAPNEQWFARDNQMFQRAHHELSSLEQEAFKVVHSINKNYARSTTKIMRTTNRLMSLTAKLDGIRPNY